MLSRIKLRKKIELRCLKEEVNKISELVRAKKNKVL